MEIRAIKILTILLLVCFGSCEDTIDVGLDTEESDLLVVEAVLTNQNLNHLVKLSHPHQEINGNRLPAVGATVAIGEGDFVDGEIFLSDTIPLFEFPAASGDYYTEPFRAVFGKVYVLFIEYQGNSYFAFDSSDPVEPLPRLDIEQVSGDVPFFRLNLSNFGSEANYVNHWVLWENSNFCDPNAGCQGKVVYYDLKTVDVHEIFKPDKTDFVFPINSVIIRTKYSVNERYRTYLRSVLSETEWRGGIFDIQRANALTNLSEGAIGFFAVSTAVSDTTIIAP